MTTATTKTTAVTRSFDKLRSSLSTKFPPDKAGEVLLYFNMLMRDAQLERWDSCLNNSGKFVEAVLKCFHYLNTGVETDVIRVEEEVRSLEQAVNLNTFEQLTIPRTLSLIYEFRDKRGGAHNFSFDPTKMDCVLVVALSKWVVEELTRLYLTNDAVAAQSLVESLLVRGHSLVEELDGDRLVLMPGLSARIQLELLLLQEHQERCSFKDLTRWAHNHSIENIRITLRTMKQKNLVHETEEGWKLTTSGILEAEVEFAKLQNILANGNVVSKSKTKGAKRGRK